MLQTTCPSAEELRQWTCGDTDESASNTLADHLQQCEQCQSTLAELDSHDSDSLIQHLKADDPLLAFRDEHDCQQASILAMGAITGQSLEETHTALPVFPKEMNDYRVLGLIAAGGMGKVYRAHHQRLGRDVAIKILSGRRLTDANASVRFEQEIRALGRLSHPNIVSALDARQCDGNPILIMEFVDGLDLSQIVKRLGPLPASSVAAIGRAVAAAIAYASNHGLVHRDIKPSNIMISAGGEVKLLDLGLARIQLDGNVAPEWTGTGLTVGTPDYMSPEQINDLETIDSRSDLYSLGCTLYRLLVGQPPYAGKKYRSNFEKLAAHVSEDPIVIPNTNGQYPAALVSIIQRLLAKSPADRPESVQSVALELEKLSNGADLAGLLAMARKLQANETEAASQAAPLNQAANSRGRIPPYVAWALALGGVPAAFFFGIWLSIKNPDGSETKVQVPSGANASVDDQGNVQIDMAKTESKIDNNSPEALKSSPMATMSPGPGGPFNSGSASSGNDASVSDAEINGLITSTANSSQPLFRGHSFEQWATALQNERSSEMLRVAVEALVSLAETPEQKSQVMRLILEKSRSYGSVDSVDAHQWLAVLEGRIRPLLPQPFLDEAIRELPQGNEGSLYTILFFCTEGLVENFNRTNTEGSAPNKCLELASAISASIGRLQIGSSASLSLPSVDFLIGRSLTFAAQTNLEFAKLDPMLQRSSENAWKKLVESKFLASHSGDSWLTYWKTLPKSDRHGFELVKKVLLTPGYSEKTSGEIFDHIDKLTPQEQSEICSILVERLQSKNQNLFTSTSDLNWRAAFKCLRRCSGLEKVNIDEAEAIAQSLDKFGVAYGNIQRKPVADASPATFAKLLGVSLPDVESPKLEPASNLTVPNEKRLDQTALPNDLEAAVKISATSDQRMFRGHSFDEWTKILANEHDGDLVIVAGEAVLTLAQIPEQKSQVVKLIFEKSRYMGSLYYGDTGSDSHRWMGMLLNHVYAVFPEPFLSSAIEELPTAPPPSVAMILTVCRSVAGSDLTNSSYTHKRDEILGSPKWKLLINQLSGADEHASLNDPNDPTGNNRLLTETLVLAGQLKIPFSDLTQKLKGESKKQWDTFQKTEISPLYYRDQNRFSNLSAPWLPYWRTLPHEQKNAPFIVRAIFANLAGTRMSSKLFFDNLGKLSPDEQSDLCEFLSERFAEYNFASETLPWHWDAMFDYLRTNSTLDKQNVTKAHSLALDLTEAIYAERNKGGPLATPKRKVDEFRQLLGLPPKTIANATTSSSASIRALNSASSTEESIKAMMSGNKESNEPLFRGYAFDDWIKALEADRSEEMQLIAGEAVLTLAETFEQQKQAAKAVLRKSRELGSYTFDQHGESSQKWMYLLKNNIGRFFPDAFLIAAIEEIPKANAKSLVTILTLCRTSSRVPNSDRPGYRFLDPTTISSPRWNILVDELSKASAQINVPRYFPDDGPSHVVTHTLTLATKLNIPFEKLQPTLQEESKRLWLDVLKGTPEPSSTMSSSYNSVISPNWFAYWKTLPSSEQQKAIVMRSVMNMQNNAQWKRKDILESFANFSSQEQTEICQLLSDRFKMLGYDPHLWNLTLDCLRRCSNLDKANIDAAEAMVEESKTSVRDVNKFRSLLGLPPEPITMPPLIQPLFEKQQSGSTASKVTDSSTAAQATGASGNTDANSDITLDSVGLGNLESGGAKQAGPKDAELDAVVQASADDGKPLFRGHPLSAWLKVLERERTYYLLSVACEASITLAESDEELLQVARALLKKNRQIGEFPWEQSALDNWLILLKSKVMFRIFPKHFVVAAIEEMDAGNKRSIHTILELATIWPDRSKYFLSGPEAEKTNEELRVRWKTLFDKLSAAEKYFDMSKTKDGSTQRDKYFQDMMALATRLDIEYSTLSPLLQAEMKQAWERDKSKLAQQVGPTFLKQHMPTWLPYWKSLPQTENNKSQMIDLLFLNYMSELNAKPKDILDHFEKLTLDEQKAIAKVLVTAYCECKFVTPEQTRVWNDIFACLKRCSTFDPKKLDEAEAKVKDAKQQYLRQSEQGRQLGFPLALKPVHIHELVGSPFGTGSAEDIDLLLPQSKWGYAPGGPAGGGYGSSYSGGSNAYGSNSGITTPSSPYGGYGIGPIISNGQSSTSQAYGGGGNQAQPATLNQKGSK